jgi:hypothetical protein
VTVDAPIVPMVGGRVCLTFTGSRISASGPIAYETVVATVRCKWRNSPIGRKPAGPDLSAADRPHVIVPFPGPPQERLEAAAHVSPWAPPNQSGGGTANLVVHFPDRASAETLEMLSRALERSGRSETATALVCVLPSEQIMGARPMSDVMLAADASAWERLLGVRGRPATVVLSPSGDVAWRHDGPIGVDALAEALRARRGHGGQVFPQFLELPLRIGQPSPNFLIDATPGEQLTLRKLGGQPVALFFGDASAPSLATLRNLDRASHQDSEAARIVAVIDGEDLEFARGLAEGEEGALIVVPDPARLISQAYGVRLWPTTVFLDAEGLVRDIQYGLISGRELQPLVQNNPVQSAERRQER